MLSLRAVRAGALATNIVAGWPLICHQGLRAALARRPARYTYLRTRTHNEWINGPRASDFRVYCSVDLITL